MTLHLEQDHILWFRTFTVIPILCEFPEKKKKTEELYKVNILNPWGYWSTQVLNPQGTYKELVIQNEANNQIPN